MTSLRLTPTSTIHLPFSRTHMPLLGFGVYQSTSARDSVLHALSAGYLHVDSARIYRNEVECFAAVMEKGKGESCWMTSKITGKEHWPVDKCEKAVRESVERAKEVGLKWDLFLLHDPTAGPVKRLSAWRVLEGFVKRGELKAIGVSNFSEIHLEEFEKAGVEIFPEVNQIELHPWCQQKAIVAYCQAHGIAIQAYCPIVRGERLDDPTLVSISKRINKGPAQILIRWSLQKGYIPLPKSDTPSRILSNFQVFDFELSDGDMGLLDGLDEGAKGACSWNPVGVA